MQNMPISPLDPRRFALFSCGLMLATASACAEPPAAHSAAQTSTASASLPAVKPTPGRAEAMARLSYMRGIWTGVASGSERDGSHYKVTQTERMGPMLGGDVVVIEGRGYRDDGSTGFNAFAVVSWEPQTQKYEMRAYAQGRVGTFDLKLTTDGYVWEIPAGEDAIVRFTATVKDGHWREVGDYIAGDKPPVRTFEMNLKRVAETDWPLGAPVPPSIGR